MITASCSSTTTRLDSALVLAGYADGMTGTVPTSRSPTRPQGRAWHRRPEHYDAALRTRDRAPAEQGRPAARAWTSRFLATRRRRPARASLARSRATSTTNASRTCPRSSTTPPPPATRATRIPGKLPLLPEPRAGLRQPVQPGRRLLRGPHRLRFVGAGPADSTR